MQLTYPWFLFGLFAVVVPLVIHLLQLRRPQRVLFTNTAFIQEVELVTVRHRKIQHWLILLARVLAVAALVLVFCQPFIPANMDKISLSKNNLVSVWVDNSYSMQSHATSGRSLLQEAITQAGILEQGDKSTRLQLLNSAKTGSTRSSYANDLNELKLGSTQSSLSSVLEAADAPAYLFSDFQKNALVPNWLDKVDANRQVVLIPLKGQPVGNIYVDSVWLDDAFVRLHANVGLHIRVRNGGLADVADCQVKVFLGNKQAVSYRVDVAAGKSAATVVQVQVDEAALVEGRVVVEDRPVTFDNAFFFTLQPAATIRVLEIGSGAVTRQVYGNEPLFAYTFAKVGQVDYGVLRQANLILVTGIQEVEAGLREALRVALRRGASVVIVPSTADEGRASYDQLFRSLGLGEAQWEGRAATPELREVAMPNVQEPFFRDVFGAKQRAVTMPRVAPVLRWSRTGTDIMRLRDGESYLAGFASGAGRVYVFSAPFAAAYSDFTEHALFVPVMYRMAMLSYRNEQLPAYRLDQDAVTLKLPPGSAGATERSEEAAFRLVKDSLTLIPSQRVADSEVRMEIPELMTAPGFYKVLTGQKVLTTVAFNTSKRESELAAYSADELRQLIGTAHPNVRVVESGVDGAGLVADSAEQTGTPLWRYFLAGALGFLLIEVLLVRFGQRRAAGRTASQAAA